jgi:hypothetical protein
MALISHLYCNNCGAANQNQVEQYFSLLKNPITAEFKRKAA